MTAPDLTLTPADLALIERIGASSDALLFHRLAFGGEPLKNSVSDGLLTLALTIVRHGADGPQCWRIMNAAHGNYRQLLATIHKNHPGDALPPTIAQALRYVAAHGRPTVSSGLLAFTDKTIMSMPDPTWCIADLVPAGGLVEVVGRYGAGKTFLFIDWLMHIAAGMSWQGHAATKGRCLYLYGEGHMKPRVAAWRTAHQVAPHAEVGVLYMPGTVNLLDDADVSVFLDRVGDLRPAAIALDTLSRMAPGDENSPEYGALCGGGVRPDSAGHGRGDYSRPSHPVGPEYAAAQREQQNSRLCRCRLSAREHGRRAQVDVPENAGCRAACANRAQVVEGRCRPGGRCRYAAQGPSIHAADRRSGEGLRRAHARHAILRVAEGIRREGQNV